MYYTLGNLKRRFHSIKKNQVSNGELHAFARLSLLLGFTEIFSGLKHNGYNTTMSYLY
jgi:hypothetical protein